MLNFDKIIIEINQGWEKNRQLNPDFRNINMKQIKYKTHRQSDNLLILIVEQRFLMKECTVGHPEKVQANTVKDK